MTAVVAVVASLRAGSPIALLMGLAGCSQLARRTGASCGRSCAKAIQPP